MDALLFSLIFALIGFVIAMFARGVDQRILMTSAVLFAIYLGLDDLATGLPSLIRSLDFLPGHWNWSGKVLSLILSVIVASSLRLSPDALGFRRQEHQKLAWISLGLFVV